MDEAMRTARLERERETYLKDKACRDCARYYAYDIDESQHAGFCTYLTAYTYEDESALECAAFKD
jgi:hypothetical protein